MSALLRALAVALLGLALWNPTWPGGSAPLDVVVAVDDSLSAARADVDAAWQRVMTAVGTLPTGSRVAVVRFAAGAVAESDLIGIGDRPTAWSQAPPRVHRLDRTASDLAAGLRLAAARLEPGRDARIIVVSDGAVEAADSADPVRSLAEEGVGVIALAVPPVRPTPRARIAALGWPTRVRAGDALDLDVELAGRDLDRTSLFVKVGAEALDPRPVSFDAAGRAHITLRARTPALPGSRWLPLEVRVGTPENGDEATRWVAVSGPPSIVYASTATGRSPLLAGLRRGGWSVRSVRPPTPLSDLAPPDVVVLDDLAVEAWPEADWTELSRWVERDGCGLLVLGGPSSFAPGGYRGSLLESLLPVTAEAGDRRGRAAVYFLIDTSGSMERDSEGRSRLSLARLALAGTLAGLEPEDRVGVAAFDVAPHEVLPLGPLGAGRAGLLASLPAASGGTRLAPALELAARRLRDDESERKLLVLVTDGFVAEEPLASAVAELDGAGVERVALAVGRDVETAPLETLVGSSGRLLRIDRSAELPRWLRAATLDQLTPERVGPESPRLVAAPPFAERAPRLAQGPWPPLVAHAVTRARPDARVWLESDEGDPLLATFQPGAGRVAVLTGGLADWAPAWTAWSEWPQLAAGLLSWLAPPAGDPGLTLRVDDAAAGVRFALDALDADGRWSREPVAEIESVFESGGGSRMHVRARSPGHFEGVAPADPRGWTEIRARLGHAEIRSRSQRDTGRERRPAPSDVGASWIASGGLEAWPRAGLPRGLHAPPVAVHGRPLAAGLALLVYAAALIWEEAIAPRRRRVSGAGG